MYLDLQAETRRMKCNELQGMLRLLYTGQDARPRFDQALACRLLPAEAWENAERELLDTCKKLVGY